MLLNPSFVDRCEEKDFNRCQLLTRYMARHNNPSPSKVATVPDRDGSISESTNPLRANNVPRMPIEGMREVIAIGVNPPRGE